MRQSETGPQPRLASVANPLRFRHPVRKDGQAVHDLIDSCEALDDNSLYCNFLQCTHFAGTCMLAEMNGEVVGWVSAYRPPEEPETLFVWQVAVAEAARGRRLARRLIAKLLASDSCTGVERLKTTITPDNASSWRMFEGVADEFDATISDKVWLCGEEHFSGDHDSEHMLTIGPIDAGDASATDLDEMPEHTTAKAA
ncbi:diaminobutyrate acetyltransferase [Aurantimonas sp. A3-2-R12]|uniref:diaminobutyrate acetyltransferase n=1 Tax=Aurantimonas sp. A3-2-R12 TaxID=3114362 RepID=UPI002E19ED2D|nr:diaminobutyrate acetyltransferase [Aurantimonas sp. A3-2-R12]